MMKKLILTLVLPLTVISFLTFTKWWYTLPVDAPDTIFSGFPFPFIGTNWGLSLSLQLFVTELIVDWLIYFLFWLTVVFLINRFWVKIKLHRALTIALWCFSVLLIVVAGFFINIHDNTFYLKRPFQWEVLETGYKFAWQETRRPVEKLHEYKAARNKQMK